MSTSRKPGRPRINEVQQRLHEYTILDKQILQQHSTWLELDISTPTLPDQIMKIDCIDYERLRSERVGRFHARESSAFSNHPIAYVNTRNKDGKFSASASYLHNLICQGSGFLWHRNADLLDNRRSNLETNIPLQSSTVELPTPIPLVSPNEGPSVFINLLDGQEDATLNETA